MGRYARNSAILAKVETTTGTDAVPTGGANAMLVSDQTINPLNAQNVDRDLVRNYFGASEQLVGTANVEISFTVELAGAGTAGAIPAWGPLLKGCGFVEDDQAAYVAYQPDTPVNQKSLTIYFYDDGVLHKLLGAKGNVKPVLSISGRPTLQFTFMGTYGGVTAAANPSTTLTAFKTPLVVTDPNTADLLLGCTYAAGALSGGSSYTSRGLELDAGNTVSFTPLVGGEFIDITARSVTGAVELDLSAADEVTFMSSVRANTVQSMGLEHGTVAGHIVGVYMAGVQMTNPKKSDVNGRRLIGFDLRSVPVSGNDDLLIYCK